MITSTNNPLIKRIKRLGRKKYRRQEGAFFAEGLRVVLSAIENNATIDTIVYCDDLLTSYVAREMLAEERAAGTRCVEISAQLFRNISDRDDPVGLGAIIAANWTTVDDLSVAPDDILVALIGISEPGNLGTILRTIDAVGAAGCLLVGQTVDPYHPTAVKASMGTIFSMPICHLNDPGELLDWAMSKSLHKIATSAHAKDSFKGAVYRFPVLLMLGSEGEGLPSRILNRADISVAIPMAGSASSLNLAVASGIFLYELAYRRIQSEA